MLCQAPINIRLSLFSILWWHEARLCRIHLIVVVIYVSMKRKYCQAGMLEVQRLSVCYIIFCVFVVEIDLPCTVTFPGKSQEKTLCDRAPLWPKPGDVWGMPYIGIHCRSDHALCLLWGGRRGKHFVGVLVSNSFSQAGSGVNLVPISSEAGRCSGPVGKWWVKPSLTVIVLLLLFVFILLCNCIGLDQWAPLCAQWHCLSEVSLPSQLPLWWQALAPWPGGNTPLMTVGASSDRKVGSYVVWYGSKYVWYSFWSDVHATTWQRGNICCDYYWEDNMAMTWNRVLTAYNQEE